MPAPWASPRAVFRHQPDFRVLAESGSRLPDSDSTLRTNFSVRIQDAETPVSG